MRITMTVGSNTDVVESLEWGRTEDGRRVLTAVLLAGRRTGSMVVTYTLLAAFASKSIVPSALVETSTAGENPQLLSRVQCTNFVVRSARLSGLANELAIWSVTLDASSLSVTDFSDTGSAGRPVTL